MLNRDVMIQRALKIIKDSEDFGKVQFIILYGSVAEDRASESSDIDLCVYYDGDEEEASRFRLKILSELLSSDYDIQIYNHLPMYIRKDVLGGEVIYCRNSYFLHDQAYQTIKEFEDFKRYYYDYIGEEEIA